jgi:hypothetical protein
LPVGSPAVAPVGPFEPVDVGPVGAVWPVPVGWNAEVGSITGAGSSLLHDESMAATTSSTIGPNSPGIRMRIPSESTRRRDRTTGGFGSRRC